MDGSYFISSEHRERIKPQPGVCISGCDRLVDNSFLFKLEQRKLAFEGVEVSVKKKIKAKTTM